MTTAPKSATSAAEYLPRNTRSLAALRKAAASCKGCALFEHATQTVFGEGDPHGRVMMVGEQPGDREDTEGHPFVGPSGRLLDEAMVEAGIERAKVYVTNAVKHFKWEPRGKGRLHKKPSSREVAACGPWLRAEIDAVEPEIVVCLGATAAQALMGRDFRVTRDRGRILQTLDALSVMATTHPAAVLRAPDEAARRAEHAHLVDDLRKVAHYLA